MIRRLYKREMTPEEWQKYLEMDRYECRKYGVSFSHFNDPDPYVELDDRAIIHELEAEEDFYRRYDDGA